MAIKFKYKEQELEVKIKEDFENIAKVFVDIQEAVNEIGIKDDAYFISITEEQLEKMNQGAALGFKNNKGTSIFILIDNNL